MELSVKLANVQIVVSCHIIYRRWLELSSERVVVRPSVCRLSFCLSSVTFVHPTQAIEIFGNDFTLFGTVAICDPSVKFLRRSSQGNPSVGGLNQRGVE